MMRILKIFKKLFERNLKQIKEEKDLKEVNTFLQEFNKLTEEIKYLILISSILWIQEDKFQKRLKKIYLEVEKLDKIVKEKAYFNLSKEKMEDLLKTLEFSKHELLKTIESAPCPTNIIQ